MNLRKDAAYAASQLSVAVREITKIIGSGQVGTVGVISPKPNLINVVPGEVYMTVDLRNIDEKKLKKAEDLLKQKIEHICLAEKVNVETEQLVRFKPVNFDKRISNIIANISDEKGLQCTRLNSGAGHDAQMMARICPTSMIFVPSKDGISHNPREYTSKEHLNYGLQILYETINRIDSNLLD
jgi:N-carbamoyl-L-amino-acid hydrolase